MAEAPQADPAAAAAEARRERRRRRILENADDRMKRFTNVKRAVESESGATLQIQDFGISKRNLQSAKSSSSAVESLLYDETLPLSEADVFLNEEELFGKMLYPGAKQSRQMQASKFNYHKVIILLLGIAIRYLNLVFENSVEIIGMDLNYLHMGSIFVPFLIYEITEFFVYPPTVETSSTLHLILMLNNIQGRGVDVVVNIANNVLRVLKDMSVYFFAYVFLDMVFAIFKVDDDVV